jgi:hypothetical protein
MAAVIVKDERVEFDEGWDVVVMDEIKRGDRVLVMSIESGRLKWADAGSRDIGRHVEEVLAVLRRSPN